MMALGGAALTSRRRMIAMAAAIIAGGLALAVATMSGLNPAIGPLMPVLQSPLLSIHVATIMCAYTLLAVMAVIACSALAIRRPEPSERLADLNRVLLYPALFLLTAGIFIGAVWANQSWGRYWGWDPKETWALITMIIYSLALHQSTLPAFRNPRRFNIFIALSFISVIITYFGVNFLMSGLHSYATV